MNRSTASASSSNRLLVGDDVSSIRNDVCILTATGEVLLNHQPFANDGSGYLALRDTLLSVFQQVEAAGVDVAIEATGWYWFHTFYALAHDEELNGLDLRLSLFNPRLTHAFKKAMASRDHSDPKDARVIAERAHFARAEHPPVLEDTWLGRRLLTRHYYHLSHALAAEKTYFSACFSRHRPIANSSSSPMCSARPVQRFSHSTARFRNWPTCRGWNWKVS